MRRSKWLIVFFVTLLISSGAHAAEHITNGSFEDGSFTGGNFTRISPGDSTTITGWTAGGDGIDWHNNVDMQSPHTGLYVVDLNYDPGDIGTISQTFPTISGEQYILTFWFAGPTPVGAAFPDPRQVQVNVAGTSETFSTPASPNTAMVWAFKTMNFTAVASSTTLEFTSVDGNGWYGPVIDDVSVVDSDDSVESVPTLSEWGMILFIVLAGLGSLYYLRRNKIEG